MRKQSYTPEQRREYSKKWRSLHPHYTRNWNRTHRNKYLKDIMADNQPGRREHNAHEDYKVVKDGHCDRCTILLTSKFAEGSNGVTCGHCLSTNKGKIGI